MLAVLWASDGPLTPNEVQERLGRPLAYTTVATILIRLAEKGMVDRARAGRGYCYRPVVEEVDHVTEQIRRVLDVSGDHSVALRGLVDSLSPDEEAELLRLLTEDRSDRGGDPA